MPMLPQLWRGIDRQNQLWMLTAGACAIDRWLKEHTDHRSISITKNSAGGAIDIVCAFAVRTHVPNNCVGVLKFHFCLSSTGCPESRDCHPKDGKATDQVALSRTWELVRSGEHPKKSEWSGCPLADQAVEAARSGCTWSMPRYLVICGLRMQVAGRVAPTSRFLQCLSTVKA
eukprot:SAG31_NODE_159_length_21911_cov_12.220750_20_plen_173_part_00